MDELVRGVRRGAKYFWAYARVGGVSYERWVSKEEFHRRTQQNLERTRVKYKADGYREALLQRAHKKYHAQDLRTRLVYIAKCKAKLKNLPFDLVPEDLENTTHCPVFGTQLERFSPKGSRLNMATLDQIVVGKGYVKGNVIIVSFLANMVKSCASPDQIMQVAKFYRALEKKMKVKNAPD